MKNLHSSGNHMAAPWWRPRPASWVGETILALVCGLGLFFLLRPYLTSDPSSLPPPGNSFWASAIPAIWSLGLASRPMAFLSCWWETTKALFFPTSSKREAQQEPSSAEEASNWESPTDSWAETSGPSLVSPPSQRLLDVVIPKRLDRLSESSQPLPPGGAEK
uniref:Uncharacterized protein n=1 Tax=Sus scrofa TaxID=9823 RepID=A0A480KYX9_PIG